VYCTPVVAYKFDYFSQAKLHEREVHYLGFRYLTKTKVITSPWLDPSHGGINLGFPQN
jgi:malonate-semialdehyde dehydrogenase (acetylating) / methylmalonate-semialdehyde dehydrogenase